MLARGGEDGALRTGALTSGDVRDLLRAVHDLHDESVPFAARLDGLARELCRLTGALQCVIGEVDASGVGEEGGAGWPLKLSARGTYAELTADQIRSSMGCFADREARDELAVRVLEAEVDGVEERAVTMSAHRAIGRETWRAGRLCAMYLRPGGLDDLLHSRAAYALRPHCYGWIGLGRKDGDAGFTAREAAIVNMLHAEVGAWLWARIGSEYGSGIPGENEGTGEALRANRAYRALYGRLSPAQRRVLPLLVRGWTQVQIGEELHRSQHTVHDHARSIYQMAGVKSKLELILRLQRMDGDVGGQDEDGDGRAGAADGNGLA